MPDVSSHTRLPRVHTHSPPSPLQVHVWAESSKPRGGRHGRVWAACGMVTSGGCVQDEQLRPLLEMYRQAGRKVFIATNSLWDYTNVVMNFLLDGKVGAQRDTEWLRVCPPPPHPPLAACVYVTCVSHLSRQADCMWPVPLSIGLPTCFSMACAVAPTSCAGQHARLAVRQVALSACHAQPLLLCPSQPRCVSPVNQLLP